MKYVPDALYLFIWKKIKRPLTRKLSKIWGKLIVYLHPNTLLAEEVYALTWMVKYPGKLSFPLHPGQSPMHPSICCWAGGKQEYHRVRWNLIESLTRRSLIGRKSWNAYNEQQGDGIEVWGISWYINWDKMSKYSQTKELKIQSALGTIKV